MPLSWEQVRAAEAAQDEADDAALIDALAEVVASARYQTSCPRCESVKVNVVGTLDARPQFLRTDMPNLFDAPCHCVECGLDFYVRDHLLMMACIMAMHTYDALELVGIADAADPEPGDVG